MRLRRALDGPQAREWLSRHRPGHRFYFGRYTGRTPVPGPRPAMSATRRDARENRLAELLRDQEQRHQQLQATTSADDDARYFLAAVDGAEMRSRWDMQASAPDLLITNYSMLSIALGREDEQPLFDQTRAWLDASPDHVFTLVVDELHTYRGTQGTEVAYLLRRLLRRLGLDERPDQLSIVATSASLNDDAEGRRFLSGFFARHPQRFQVVSTPPRRPAGDARLADLADALRAENDSEVDRRLPGSGAGASVFDALTRDDQTRPRPFGAVARSIFGDAADAESLLDRVVAALARQKRPDVRLRSHLFFRTLQGLWACSDPDCGEVSEHLRSQQRRVGKLYTRPLFACPCGGRVLELLYCEACGEVMLGGYVTMAEGAESLVSVVTDLQQAPDRTGVARTGLNYRVYWPTSRHPVLSRTSWQRTGEPRPEDPSSPSYQLGFDPTRLSPATARLDRVRRGDTPTGWVFRITCTSNPQATSRMPAMPTRCPGCGEDRERRLPGVPVESTDRSRSSIRTQGLGFERTNQVLTEAVHRDLGPNLVLFSDSRQSAARVAANLELNHYQDAVRALTVAALGSLTGGLERATAWASGASDDPADKAAFDRLRQTHPLAAQALDDLHAARPREPGPAQAKALADLQDSERLGPTLPELARAVQPELLRRGVNPAGPGPSLQVDDLRRPTVRWTELWAWTEDGAVDVTSGLTDRARALKDRIGAELERQVARTVFASGRRDMESIGIGVPAPANPVESFAPTGMANEVFEQACCSVVRLLGRRWRLVSLQENDQRGWPRNVKDYVTAVAEIHLGSSSGAADLLQASRASPRRRCGNRVPAERRSHPTPTRHRPGLALRPLPHAAPTPQRRHLHDLPTATADRSRTGDAGGRLLRLAEPNACRHPTPGARRLTGQTDVRDAQARQAQFQGVFLTQDENHGHRRRRRAVGDDDDGGRRRHRSAEGSGDDQHASATVQLPAACRAGRATRRPPIGRLDRVPWIAKP